MPEYPEVIGFSGKWYHETAQSASPSKLSTGRNVLLPCVSRLFACKLEAFFDRGIGDPIESTDLEDIAALLDGCSELETKLSEAPGKGMTIFEYAPRSRGAVDYARLTEFVADMPPVSSNNSKPPAA